MKFFMLYFPSAPASEGDGIIHVPRRLCGECGLKGVPISKKFLVPEDSVNTLDLAADTSNLPDIFEAGGMLICTSELAEKLRVHRFSGFSERPVRISNAETGEQIRGYTWVVIDGRCETSPVWRKIISRCKECGRDKTAPVDSLTRIPSILGQEPACDFLRSQERAVGIIVSQKVKTFLSNEYPKETEFKQIKE